MYCTGFAVKRCDVKTQETCNIAYPSEIIFMIFIRYVLSISVFVTGIFCVIAFFSHNWNWFFLLGFIACSVLAYWIKPVASRRQRIQRRHSNNSHTRSNDNWMDVIDLPIEFLFQVISWPFRLLGKLLKHLDFDVSPDL